MSAGGLGGAAPPPGRGRIGGRSRHAHAHVRREPALVASPDQLVRDRQPRPRCGCGIRRGGGRVVERTAGVEDRRCRRRPRRPRRRARRPDPGLPSISIPGLPSFVEVSNDAYTARRPAAGSRFVGPERRRRGRQRHVGARRQHVRRGRGHGDPSARLIAGSKVTLDNVPLASTATGTSRRPATFRHRGRLPVPVRGQRAPRPLVARPRHRRPRSIAENGD